METGKNCARGATKRKYRGIDWPRQLAHAKDFASFRTSRPRGCRNCYLASTFLPVPIGDDSARNNCRLCVSPLDLTGCGKSRFRADSSSTGTLPVRVLLDSRKAHRQRACATRLFPQPVKSDGISSEVLALGMAFSDSIAVNLRNDPGVGNT